MPDISINGITVSFPKEPYECQVRYMEANIRAISMGTNALLESPTGTGKTLCLLCSTLAWHGYNNKSKPNLGASLAYSSSATNFMAMPASTTAGTPQVGLIIYASRTHSQISQVVSELKSTSYRPKMTVLGSRDQLCIHEKVSKLKGGALNHACNVLSAKRGCTYKNNIDSYGGPIDNFASKDVTALSRPILDIEELVSVGRKDRICPYFYSRDSSSHSEMVLLPYNYLLDSSIRKTLKISWQDAIVIFDEGHNLERVASDAASFVFTSTEIAECIQNLQAGLAILHEEAQLEKLNKKNAVDDNNAPLGIKAATEGSGDGIVQRPKLQSIIDILTAVFSLEAAIAKLPLTAKGMIPNTVSTVLPGKFLRELFIQCGILPHHSDELRKCANMLMEAASDSLGNNDSSSGNGTVMSVTVPKIMDFANAVDRVHGGAKHSQYDDYKVYICEEEVKRESRSMYGNSPAGKGGYHNASPNAYGPTKRRVIHYWCFSPGIAMEELKALGVRSIILTSGTLSPMAALREDMKLPFPVQLENPHVIGGNQMWVGALNAGPRGSKLNSTFNNRDSSDYKDELGWSILQICLTMMGKGTMGLSMPGSGVIPQGNELRGGILVFYPSYGAMEGFISHWDKSGMLDKMRNIVGAIVIEPRGSGKSTMGDSKSNSHNNNSNKSSFGNNSWGTGSSFKENTNFMTSHIKKSPLVNPDIVADVDDPAVRGVIGEFEGALQKFGSCLLMAVCRGKVSEGIDFTDNKGRCVIITGIPFAPFMDPWVILKKDYLDGKVSKALTIDNSTIPTTTVINPYSGKPMSTNPYSNSIKSEVKPEVSNNPYSNGSLTLVKSEPKVAAVVSQVSQNGQVTTSARNMWSTSSATNQSTGYYGTLPAAPVDVKSTTTYPPAPGSTVVVKSSSTNSLNSMASNNSGGGGTVKPVIGLSGQSWYNQSASRAINQCLGRVIRHKKDWGAVFLLDDRFQYDAQSSQLSSWVKPSYKKFTSFNNALHQFRGFLSSAMNDKNLNLVMEVEKNKSVSSIPLTVHVNPKVSTNVPINRNMESDEAYLRSVTIDETALNGDGVSNFIDPEILSTQNNSNTTNNYPLFGAKKPIITEGSTGASLQSVKSTALKAPNAPKFGLSAASKDFSFAPPPVPKFVDLTDDNTGEENVNVNTSSSLTVTNSQSNNSNTSATAKPRFGLSSQQSNIASILPSQSQASSADTLKEVFGKLKHLSESSLAQLKRIMMECKTKSNGKPINHISQVKNLVDSIVPLFASLPADIRKSSLLSLSVLVDNNMQTMFETMVNQACNSFNTVKIKTEIKSEDKSSSSSGSISSKLLASTANCYGHIDNEEVLSHSSKRAKTMLSASQNSSGGSGTAALLASIHSSNSSTTSKRPDFLSQLKNIDAMELSQAPVKTKVSVGSSLTDKRLQCIMCQEVATNPAAARCGHVSCEVCWKQWLKVNQSCPLCRKPASESTITRLVIKKPV